MISTGMLLSDRYEILEKIGSGGMSDVYKAKCHKLNRLVAVKVLKQEYSTDKNFVSKFWAEAQSAAGLVHSNIVNVYDVGNEQDIYYIVMELVEGITLKKYIEKKGKLEVRESIGIAMQVCQGIEAAHEQKIIHRDIKPQNIMISKDGKVKVTDFGIARAATTQTISSNAMGSVHYISPEQARGGYCDERSDIYSMGIVMYEMLTGQVPFEGESTVQVALMHIQTEMVPPTMHEPTIPVSLEKIILKCTQKKPEARYASVAALLADLRRALMTPDEDFVKIVPVVTSNDPTRVMSNEEVEQIKNETRAAVPAVDEEEEAYLMGYEEEDEVTEAEDDDEDEDEDEESNPTFEKVITGISIGVAILIVILAVWILGRALNLFGGDETTPSETITTEAPETTTEEDSKTAKMPYLVGMTLGEAEALLTERQLGISVEYVAAPGEEEGIVLSQEFEEGADVNKHYRVSVVVCDNSGIADIPMDLVGSSYEAVRKALLNAGFSKIQKIEEYDDDVEEGLVIALEPEEGTVGLEKDTVIEVTVSKGPEVILVVIPNVEGDAQVNAEGALKQKGLKVKVELAYSDTVEAGFVISQSVRAGREIEIGTTVTIVVSQGTDKITVPDLEGMTVKEAAKALEELGLRLDSTYEEGFSDTVAIGLVMGQSAEAESLVEAGTVIKITLSKGPENVVVPKLTGTEAEIRAALEALGLVPEIVIVNDPLTAAGQVVRVTTENGTELVLGTSTVPAGAKVIVYISSGKEMVTIPNLRGTKAEIEAALTALGLVPRVTEDYNDTVPAGEVISCNPGMGTSVEKGSTVTVVVSKGAEPEPETTEPETTEPETTEPETREPETTEPETTEPETSAADETTGSSGDNGGEGSVSETPGA